MVAPWTITDASSTSSTAVPRCSARCSRCSPTRWETSPSAESRAPQPPRGARTWCKSAAATWTGPWSAPGPRWSKTCFPGSPADEFGTMDNAKGFRELDPHVGAIYGDSITYERAEAITANLMRQGFASTTVIFGYGSYTYQYQTRDTFKMAMKAT
ncbi:hypothetical protein [Mycobacterium sp. 050134]|uniref:hypothetical protein n=1 Tax=Mycobacterium sp. 050134 TaxID=3096111 RepID=UPI002ED81F01